MGIWGHKDNRVPALQDEAALNTTHRQSDGSDHSFLDQSVIVGASPIFDSKNFTNRQYSKNEVDGLEVEFVDSDNVKINTGFCRSDDDSTNIDVDSLLNVDITASGANGLDTGSQANSTWYSIWVIYNPTTDTVAGLFSTSTTSPTLPAGYTKKRRVGWVRNYSLGNFIPFSCTGRGKMRKYASGGNITQPLSGGTATSYTTIDLSDYIPPTSRMAILDVEIENTVDDVEKRVRLVTPPFNSYGIGFSTRIYGHAERGTYQCSLGTNASREIQYRVDTNGSTNIYVHGYKDNI
jgi:hypothetical protein